MPDYYRGEMCDPSKEGDRVVKFLQDKTKWSELQVDWEKKIKPFAEKLGAKTYGTVGKTSKLSLTFQLVGIN